MNPGLALLPVWDWQVIIFTMVIVYMVLCFGYYAYIWGKRFWDE